MLIYLVKNYLFLLLRTSNMTGNGNDGKAFDNFITFLILNLSVFNFACELTMSLLSFLVQLYYRVKLIEWNIGDNPCLQ